jgi:hypothetical protein
MHFVLAWVLEKTELHHTDALQCINSGISFQNAKVFGVARAKKAVTQYSLKTLPSCKQI